ncbi:MAG: nuclear transport factor 2 family protein [Actinomycetota bacterium]
MSQENVDRVERAFAAFSSGDLETAFEFIDPSFEVNDRVVPEASPSERGPDALIANAGQVREAFGDIAWEPREIVDRGDRILVRVHISARGLHTSLPIDDDVGHVYTMREGKAVHLDIFRTWGEALEAAGLRE